jgi:hypothetical protein
MFGSRSPAIGWLWSYPFKKELRKGTLAGELTHLALGV